MSAQVFKPSANSIAQVAMLSIAIGVPTVWLSIAGLSRSPANTKVDVPLNQPVPFSHQHHAWELGIDCRYCHTSVEKSSYAGLPSTETCMSCHSQIWTNSPLLEPVRRSYETGTPIKWNLVNKVPQFVHFNHSIHINRGINCDVCHGAVQYMQITFKGNSFQMAWCLQCHRAPERYVYKDETAPATEAPRNQVFNLYWKFQEKGMSNLSDREKEILHGDYGGSDDAQDKTKGKELVSKYGIHVAQLADCSVCHY
ncbi:cytochrome c3 family protein [Fimbriimonas ginsengisoli]|uniref:Molybdopterin oxidoreductase subunit n=1 Tax=Fimbriimonas ginsengisoli Gsoil 348 TaxID=661478 RepID=A0A068NPU8_FIMGI|nr:cytochrome c3 family protein [Fimbriimonas ginsengisoli]AIE85548.1 Molybdopterin oxidoreductase subunit [Fimbriimonas ginsengisoli Gsoil 348]